MDFRTEYAKHFDEIHWKFITSKQYKLNELNDWEPVSLIQNSSGHPGDLGM